MQLVVGDELTESLRDPLEQHVGALLGEDLMEDLGQAPVGLDERTRLGSAGLGLGVKLMDLRQVVASHSIPRIDIDKRFLEALASGTGLVRG